ncbi:alpha/beta fold hydrolase [Nocardia acidivorans]|uniref:alpha/beta fold hydrolase n=1 Tax=Nocardia acidivorans TaxID=404580 RepID=UPI001C3FF600|nr:alpha/beta fold hydrolase [Nocardia acidivorans]
MSGRRGRGPRFRADSIARSVRELAAFIDHLDKGRVDIIGFSAGAAVLAQSLAEPDVAARIHKAIIAEPGPMDGPTAQITGHRGRPNARDRAPAARGPRSTSIPRYAVAFGLMRFGLLRPDSGLIGQAEGDNAFTAADLGSDTASAYRPRDGHRIPAEDTAENFSFSPAASMQIQQTVRLPLDRRATTTLRHTRDADDRRMFLADPSVGDHHPG